VSIREPRKDSSASRHRYVAVWLIEGGRAVGTVWMLLDFSGGNVCDVCDEKFLIK